MPAEATPPRARVRVSEPTSWDTTTLRGLIEIIREDHHANPKGFLTPAKQMLMVHRFGVWAGERRGLVRFVLLTGFRIANMYVRNVLGYEVYRTTRIGRRVVFVHQHGIVLQPEAAIGDECMIYHNVTVGRRWEETMPANFREAPRIGRGVHLGVGSSVLGGVRVGDGVKVGAHALVTTDVPEGASVVAPPSRVLRLRGEDTVAAAG